MEKFLKSIAINHGLYLGIALAILTVTAYTISLDLYTKIWFGLTILALIIVFGIISVYKTKIANGGFLSFKNSFVSYFITILIGLIISTVISIIIFNIIDPEAATVIQEKVMVSQIERLEAYNVPVEVIDETMKKMEEQGNMFSIGNVFQSLIFQIVGFCVVGLIVAAAMKKNNPDDV
ncbi:DUF4199 domain-containing protein [Algibacter pectinivorans]|uniref:DUF4199 domain-containing protein n=1 Tax=Algibacter pectinivorans TaxID=870482 RepID=A0A1I1RTQ8_9FLAO|nr:DUF4199 domain-containing protein [Algibacter pectinivorans]SFD37621.1 Protein of unknown function [Algibacter pectinivorans]